MATQILTIRARAPLATEPSPETRSARAQRRSTRVRYAVVGIGHIAQAAVLPAFANAKSNSELVALVSDDPLKLRSVARMYGVRNVYSYDEYDACLRSGLIDAVYVALPNHLHAQASVRAADAGIHVLCEKPMAITETECREMIRAAHENSVRLMVAYRLHFERANLDAIAAVHSSRFGDPRIFDSVFSMQVQDRNIRIHAELGGGPLHDLGIYCINAARYLFRDEPIEVTAFAERSGDERFREVPEMISAVLRFPQERLATFTCSFGAADVSRYQVVGTKGHLELDPAFEYSQGLRKTVTGRGSTRRHNYPRVDQFAAELLYFSSCILNDREPEPSGEEGLADVRVIEAIQKSIATRNSVRLPSLDKTIRPSRRQAIRRPPPAKKPIVHARRASKP